MWPGPDSAAEHKWEPANSHLHSNSLHGAQCSRADGQLRASRTAGQRRPAETPPEQKAGLDGGSGPDADPHHRTALPAYV